MFWTFLVMGLLGFQLAHADVIQEKPMVIVIPSYNNKQWYKKNLDSVFTQKYDNYRVIYIDDCSPDGTGKLVEAYIKECGQEHRVTLICNQKNVGALANIYDAVHNLCKDHEIVINLDGDDWFAHNQVLQIFNEAYQDLNVWLTYGQYQEVPSGAIGASMPVPQRIIKHNLYKEIPWITSAPRTFYAWLFKCIKKEDLLYEGHFFKVSWDLAFMFPMLEMASGRCKFIPEVLYIYNRITPFNDGKVRAKEQAQQAVFIRKKKKYSPIDGVPLKHEVSVRFDDSLIHTRKNPEALLARKYSGNPLFKKALPILKSLYQKNNAAKVGAQHTPRIPKIIHQIWLGSPLPERYKKWQQSWIEKHPDWQYILWTDTDIEKFGLYNKDLYEQSTNYGERSDLARIEILHRFGGLYIDTDFECLKSFDSLHHTYDFYAGMVPINQFGILANGIIASVPRHHILESYIKGLRDWWGDKGVCERGPYYFDYCFMRGLMHNDERVIAFPPSYFFPFTGHDVKECSSESQLYDFVAPETMAIHFWDGSWGTDTAQVKKKPSYEIISLGYRCQPAMQLRFNGLRRKAYPLDWLITPFDSLYQLLENDFEGFLDQDNLVARLDYYYEDDGGRARGTYPHIWEKKYDVMLRHDFELRMDFMDRYQTVKEKYERRIKRFYDVLSSGKRIYFIRRIITKEQAKRLNELLQRKFPHLDYRIIALDFDESAKEPWHIPNVKNYHLPLPVPYNRDGDNVQWFEIFEDVGFMPEGSRSISQKDYEVAYKQMEQAHIAFNN